MNLVINMAWNYEKIEDTRDPPADLRENFKNWQFPVISKDGTTKYGWRVFGWDEKRPSNLKIGYGSDISTFTVIFAHDGVTIEPYVQIGPHSSIMSRSTIDNKFGAIVLKRNCRIGAYSTIMPNVTIGENAVIGAYSFVTHDIPANKTAYGIPCKIKD
jgi:acetyltransferase-like isoleucine patch superfamily enzyme